MDTTQKGSAAFPASGSVRYLDGAGVVDLGGGDEGVQVLGLDRDVDQRDLHEGGGVDAGWGGGGGWKTGTRDGGWGNWFVGSSWAT